MLREKGVKGVGGGPLGLSVAAALLFLLGGAVTDQFQKPNHHHETRGEQPHRITLENALASAWVGSWPAKKKELLDAGRLDPEQLSAEIDTKHLRPWPEARVRLEQILLDGFSYRERIESLIAWGQDSFHDDKPFYLTERVNPDHRRLGDEDVTAILSISESYDAEMMPVAGAVAGALFDALSATLRRDEFKRIPASATSGEIVVRRGANGALNYSTGLTVEGWDVEIHIDSAMHPELDEAYQELRSLKAARTRAVRSYIASISS